MQVNDDLVYDLIDEALRFGKDLAEIRGFIQFIANSHSIAVNIPDLIPAHIKKVKQDQCLHKNAKVLSCIQSNEHFHCEDCDKHWWD